ncbi:MAG: CusA/CzcA family heavy metal efflux RND transporter [Lewinellaceae bacterium]|nr:CusA/CzcA family heavy metal efflux RND transporter [Lewinellaceae bacterium]
MIGTVLHFSVRNKWLVALAVAGLILGGVLSLRTLPIDAVPDITNNQVQVVTVSPSLAAQEVEQLITYPVEAVLANLPGIVEIRSISRYGLSVVTVVFEERMPVLEARQLVKEQIGVVESTIPSELGAPELMPITTGLGEIYQYVLEVKPGYEDRYDPMELRTIQDWIIKRQLAGTKGIIEVSSFGGYLKQYEVALNPLYLQSTGVSIADVFEALSRNNQNSGGSYIEKNARAYYIRTEGFVNSLDDIKHIVVSNRNNIPIYIKDVGQVQWGSPKRLGAMTMDGKGEAVGGITLMLKGANSSDAIANVHERIEEVSRSLPEGIELYPYLDRSVLVDKTTHTVSKNLLEGGLIVIFVLILLLGDWRAGFIVASVIPLAMLFAIILMSYFGVSANLMSLGAIDFGIVVDGAVIVVEGVMHTLFTFYVGKKLTQPEMDAVITDSSSKLFRTAIFGVFIILVVFIPIMTLTGVEGKMFRPMAYTFSFAVLGALLLSLTYVPMMAAWILPKNVRTHKAFADKLVGWMRASYRPSVSWVLKRPVLVLSLAGALLVSALLVFRSLGSEFIPTLEEGDLAMQMAIQPGSSLRESIKTTTKAESILLANFPEVKHVVSKIGTAEVPTDPMAVEDADIMIVLKEKGEWTSASTREELVEKMKASLEVIAGASFEFTQPIQLRFNELMTGAKADIAIKIFGEDTEELKKLADEAAALIEGIPGAADIKVEQTEGLPQLLVRFNRQKIAEYGLSIQELNSLVRTAYAGEAAGVVFEQERQFDLVVRLAEPFRESLNLEQLYVYLQDGKRLPLSEVASVDYVEGPMQISRENARRRITIGVNVRQRDLAGLVEEIQQTLGAQLALPAGYTIRYGGQFENLQAAQRRLSIAVPAALLLIFLLLYFTFGSLKDATLIFSAVPLAAVGGVFGLWIRGMPFSISAGVGFIALFGVAVLNGIVLISYFKRLQEEEGMTDMRKVVIEGGCVRLRPVIMTATVAALGFLPMALSGSNGAEVQKPLATVVIGGLVTATLLTLMVLPLLYFLVNRKKKITPPAPAMGLTGLLVVLATLGLSAQSRPLDMKGAEQYAVQNHPLLHNADLQISSAGLEMDAARQLPAFQSDLVMGQVNTGKIDYNLSLVQPLNPIGLNAQRKEWAAAQKRTAVADRGYLERQVRQATRRAWLQWAWRYHRLHWYEAQEEVYATLLEKVNIQWEQGDTEGLTRVLADAELTKARKATAEAKVELDRAFSELRQLTFLEAGDWTPPQDSLSPFPLPAERTLDAALLTPWQERELAAAEAVDVERAKANPAFSIGYFNQSIQPDIPLQGVSVGMSWPLWRKGYHAKEQQTQLLQQVAANETLLQENQWETQFESARDRAGLLDEQWQSNGVSLLSQAAAIRQLAGAQWRAGETGFLQYSQLLRLALEDELASLDLLYERNLAILDLTFFLPLN